MQPTKLFPGLRASNLTFQIHKLGRRFLKIVTSNAHDASHSGFVCFVFCLGGGGVLFLAEHVTRCICFQFKKHSATLYNVFVISFSGESLLTTHLTVSYMFFYNIFRYLQKKNHTNIYTFFSEL